MKLKIKKGDTVVVLRGKDRGKSGKVLQTAPSLGRIVVEGLNLAKKHVRPRRQGEKGEMVSVPRAVPVGAVALFCGTCNRGVRFGVKKEEKDRVRVCKRCGNSI
ncbi:MAG: 50S ribosomal protein L24 [Candidatus Brennerbacteria bacterium]|nr:50S ribosomal protein L24 [Candidatus Brennerbacteria bacterium]